jgi:hypothetical protein
MPMHWIQTSQGLVFHPLDPKPEEIDPRDIARGLANENRFAGQTEYPYSVARHSLMVSHRVSHYAPDNKELALVGLLHDASEAYIKDIPRAFKRAMPEYLAIERKVMEAIFNRFGLIHWLVDGKLPSAVKQADEDALFTEAYHLFPNRPDVWNLTGSLIEGPWYLQTSNRVDEEQWRIELRRLGGK